jgi:hypothetical protein
LSLVVLSHSKLNKIVRSPLEKEEMAKPEEVYLTNTLSLININGNDLSVSQIRLDQM